MLQPILDHRKKHVAFLYFQNEQRLREHEQRRIRAMAEESYNQSNVEDLAGGLSSPGEGNDLSELGEFEGIARAMESPESLVPNRSGAETGFLDQTLPIPKEYIRYLENE